MWHKYLLAFCPGMLLSWARLGQRCLCAWARLSLQAEGKSCWTWCPWGRQSPPRCSGLQTGPDLGPRPLFPLQLLHRPPHDQTTRSSLLLILLVFCSNYWHYLSRDMSSVELEFKKDLACAFYIPMHTGSPWTAAGTLKPLLLTDAVIIILETIAWGVLLWMISFIMMKAINSEEC